MTDSARPRPEAARARPPGPRRRRRREPPGREALNGLARTLILAAVGNRAAEAVVRRYGMRLGASRFVAGDTLDACVAVIRRLNAAGFRCNATVLGEAVADRADADQAVGDYLTLLERLGAERLDANPAVKLTLLGLAIAPEVAGANLARVVERAWELEQFVRIDMEESCHVEATLRLYGRLRERGRDNVGPVLQAYLYRSADDLERLLVLRPNLRLVKGAYLERPAVAFPRKADVDRSFVRLIERSLPAAGFTAVATHDPAVIEHTIEFAQRHRIAAERFEFQMLYGVRPQLQQSLVARGLPVRVATSFGPHWYPFFMRRLAERPANVLFLLRNLVRS